MNSTSFINPKDFENLVKYFDGDTLAAQVWLDKYALKSEDGNPIEKLPSDMHMRMAHALAKAELKYSLPSKRIRKRLSDYGKTRFLDYYGVEGFYSLFDEFKYIVPGGSMMANLGNPAYGSTSNCFFIALENDSMESIFKVGAQLASIFKYRGGCGINISKLRPAGAYVHNSAKSSSGSVSFTPLFSEIARVVGQDGRRAAMMISLSSNHPDLLDFIKIKRNLNMVTGANISVQMTDTFLFAVKHEKDYFLRWHPILGTDFDLNKLYLSHTRLKDMHLPYNKLVFLSDEGVYIKRINAKEVYTELVKSAHLSAEPGILFWDTTLNYSLSSYYPRYREEGTNPCVTPDTTILTKTGFVTIGSVIGQEIEIWNGHEWTMVRPFKTSDLEKVYLITFSDGNSLKCTNYHEFIMKDLTRKQLKDCNINDKLAEFSYPDGKIINDLVIVSIIEAGFSDTYCLTDEKNHSCLFNHVMTGQCGEIPLADKDACRLFAINLGGSNITATLLYKLAYDQVVIADLSIDVEDERIQKILNKIGNKSSIEYQLWQSIQQTAKDGRRIGCGITGLFEEIANQLERNPNLTQDQILEHIETIFQIKMEAELDATIDLAILKGAFKGYDKKESSYMLDHIKDTFPMQYKRMLKYGRRNVSFSTIAPTGTISVLTGTTSGIEPLFAPYYIRRRKVNNTSEKADSVDVDGEKFTNHYVVHRGLVKYAKSKGIDTSDPNINWENIFNNSPYKDYIASKIPIDIRLKIQSIAQEYTTHSISSTLNLPENTNIEDINTIFEKAHSYNLKGVTVYREGSRNGILVTQDTPNKVKFPQYDSPKRPNSLEGELHITKAQGDTYAIIIGLLDNKPYEIFAALSQQYKPQKGRIIKVKRGVYKWIGNDGSVIENLNTLSEFSTERALTLLVSMLLRHGAKIPFVVNVVKKTDSNIISFNSAICRILSKYIQKGETGEVCPECGEKLIRESGCTKCTSCSYSICMIVYETKN